MSCFGVIPYFLVVGTGAAVAALGLFGVAIGRSRRALWTWTPLIAGGPLAAYLVTFLIPPDVALSQSSAGENRVLDGPRLKRVWDIPAQTDRGQSIPLYRPAEPVAGETVANSEYAHARFAYALLTTAPPGGDYNCHGWVFAEGRYWIRPDAVPAILRDNGYQPVRDPRPDDLIIYWDANGWPVHSGVVRSVVDGLILVESRWGHGARYLHRPEDQIFSTAFVFVRSARSGHLLKGLDD